MPKIYKGPIYILFAIDWWLLAKLTIFKPLPPGVYRIDFSGTEMLIALIWFCVLLSFVLFGIIYTIQGVQKKIKTK
ncbi:hypothetical protein KY348_03255 [Candidatus Woesearchaeota archaeon]|nr:hypothetical protein [Candidatus Woesearchaeota archaeon]